MMEVKSYQGSLLHIACLVTSGFSLHKIRLWIKHAGINYNFRFSLGILKSYAEKNDSFVGKAF